MIDIYIYRTNVTTPGHIQKVHALFQRVLSIKRWTFDLEDCDRVLRIEADGLRQELVPLLLADVGIFCEPLAYE